MTSPVDDRLHYLDNLRSVIIVCVVFFHGILPYSGICPWWYVIDEPPIPQAPFLMILSEPILMPVLFLISGMLAWPSYERRGPSRFMVSKVKRLVVPLLLCTFLFSPIMPFVRMLQRSGEAGVDAEGFWPFWLDFVSSGSDVYAGLPGSDTDLVVNQYWFLGLLFVFFTAFWLYGLMSGSAATPPRIRGSGSEPSPKALLALLAAFSLVLALAYAVAGTFIDANLWVTAGSLVQIQPVKVTIYLALFLFGIYVERQGLLPGILAIAKPRVWFVIGILMAAAYLTAVVMTFPPAEPSLPIQFAARLLRICFLLPTTLFLLSFFSRHLNGAGTPWHELSANSYNIYLIHMVPQVVLQLLALSWPIQSDLKFMGVSLLTLLFSHLVSRFLVRKSARATISVLVLLFISMSLLFR
jgi:hypothetical protein